MKVPKKVVFSSNSLSLGGDLERGMSKCDGRVSMAVNVLLSIEFWASSLFIIFSFVVEVLVIKINVIIHTVIIHTVKIINNTFFKIITSFE